VSLAGSCYSTVGEHERAIDLRRRALRMRPDSESAGLLWREVARESVALGRGADAVEAYRNQSEAGIRRVSLDDLRRRAIGFALADRPEEAIALVERVLRSPADEQGDARLMAAHWMLAEIARLRGWPDEALAQTDWCL